MTTKDLGLGAFVVILLCSHLFAGSHECHLRGESVLTPSGLRERLPTETPVIGKTTRQQVQAHYQALAVESGLPDLFWGRFRKSRWVNFERVWDTYNLLIIFDSSGLVKSCDTVSDEKLIDRFGAMYEKQSFPMLDLSQPINVSGSSAYTPVRLHQTAAVPVNLQLSSGEMLVIIQKSSSDKRLPSSTFKVPATQVSFDTCCEPSTHPASELAIELKFSKKTIVGKSMYFTAEPRVTLLLVRWLQQVKARE